MSSPTAEKGTLGRALNVALKLVIDKSAIVGVACGALEFFLCESGVDAAAYLFQFSLQAQTSVQRDHTSHRSQYQDGGLIYFPRFKHPFAV